MELDAKFKQLVQELGHAINDSLSESTSISEVMGRIRAAGYDLFLVLEVTVGFNRREPGEAGSIAGTPPADSRQNEFQLTNQDTQFLRALRISIDESARDVPPK